MTWYDRRDHTMNFIRNSHRPLIFARINGSKTIFWASEYELLMASIYRNGFTPDEPAREFLANHHYKWAIPESDKEAIGDPVRVRLEEHAPPKYGTGYFNQKKTQQTGKTETPILGKMTSLGTAQDTFEERMIKEAPAGMEWKGRLIGYVKKEPETAASVVDKALNKLRSTISLPAAKAEILPPVNLTSEDVIRKRAWEHAEKAGIVPVEFELQIKKFDGLGLKVWRHTKTGEWTFLRYETFRQEWAQFVTTKPPEDIPYTLVDINARHCFEHRGKKKRKKIYYKGYNTLLDRHIFETMMNEGCLSCERIPEWGNEVTFVSPQHEFLCEWCSLTPNLVQSLVDINKPKTTEKAA